MATEPWNPITPDAATPEKCLEVFAAYQRYLEEREVSAVEEDPARANKIERSLRYCEQTLAYWMSFLLDTSGETDPITDEVRWQISELRVKYADEYTVPQIEADALRLAKEHAKRSRKSARASVARHAPPPPPPPPALPLQAPLLPPEPVSAPGEPVIAAGPMETALARSFGLTVHQLRVRQGRA